MTMEVRPPPRSSASVFGNDDVLVRVMEFLGPRHARVGIGSTCRYLRRLSGDDSLWVAFWEDRCLLPRPREGGDGGGTPWAPLRRSRP